MLFTSYRALREAAGIIRTALPGRPVFEQGSEPRPVLLQRFRDHGSAVLLGTGSFREGVDVRGKALTLVMIDKLPFAPPDDPVFQARSDAMRRTGKNPFFDAQLPEAVVAMKQGAGRLIRDVNDRGVLMCCDPRLFSKAYGKVFLANLPPMPVMRDEARAVRFLEALPASLPAAAGVEA